MPPEGEYVLTNTGFSQEGKPFITLQSPTTFFTLQPLAKTLTLRFDTSQRYCIGWRDITTGERYVCPGKNKIEGKYEECAACQQRTGFNPAFYHANSVSDQQAARNQEPHFLYIAHFGPRIIKVGISHHTRGHSRLLEQGARSSLILDIFPSALIARQYEAKIAALPNIVETIQLNKKIVLLSSHYEAALANTELIGVRGMIEQKLSVTFAHHDVLYLDDIYFPTMIPSFDDASDCSSYGLISGKTSGMLGSLLFCEHQNRPIFLPLKKYLGYKVWVSFKETFISLPARQASLF